MKLDCAPPHGLPAYESTSLTNLFDSSDQWPSLFERSTLGVAIIDSEFHFLIANPAFLTMFGYSSEELQRLSFLDICIDETLDQCRGQLRELSDGVRLQYEIETQHRRKDGTFVPVNTYFSAVSERQPTQRISYSDSRYFGSAGGRRCITHSSIGTGEGRTTDNSGCDGSYDRARDQPTASGRCSEW
jgi:PAS domain S-box-containing protein